MTTHDPRVATGRELFEDLADRLCAELPAPRAGGRRRLTGTARVVARGTDGSVVTSTTRPHRRSTPCTPADSSPP